MPPGAGMIARHPHIVPIAASVGAWAALLSSSQAAHGHGSHGYVPPGPATAVMVVAMMGLLCIPGVRTVAFTSPWWRSHRAVVVFFLAFVGVWIIVATGMHAVMAAVTRSLAPAYVAAILLAAAALVQFSTHRRLLAGQCDRPMRVRAQGGADLDCARFGAVTAGRCARLCALPMLAMFAIPANPVLMAALTGLVLVDRVFEQRLRVAVAIGYVSLAVGLLAGTVGA